MLGMKKRGSEGGGVPGVGPRLRRHREQAGLLIAEVARRAGFSGGYISLVERDLTNPSVSALKRITDAIGIPLASLFADPEPGPTPPVEIDGEPAAVVRANRRKVIIYPGSSIRHEMLSPDLKRKIEFLQATVPPGAGSGDEPYQHEGEEIGVVVRGQLECLVGGKVYHLTDGDSIYFESHVPHSWRNAGETPLEIIWVSTPPTF
jgi:transcriptional regulator with XRE-family HTH domain